MPARHAALRARTGCDLQRIDDVDVAIRAFGARYLDRVYTAREQRACHAAGVPSASSLAARFAAKEAVLKLIGTTDGVDLRSIEIDQADGGRPLVRLSGRAAELARAAALGEIDVSLSHSGDVALATAVALQAAPAAREERGDE